MTIRPIFHSHKIQQTNAMLRTYRYRRPRSLYRKSWRIGWIALESLSLAFSFSDLVEGAWSVMRSNSSAFEMEKTAFLEHALAARSQTERLPSCGQTPKLIGLTAAASLRASVNSSEERIPQQGETVFYNGRPYTIIEGPIMDTSRETPLWKTVLDNHHAVENIVTVYTRDLTVFSRTPPPSNDDHRPKRPIENKKSPAMSKNIQPAPKKMERQPLPPKPPPPTKPPKPIVVRRLEPVSLAELGGDFLVTLNSFLEIAQGTFSRQFLTIKFRCSMPTINKYLKRSRMDSINESRFSRDPWPMMVMMDYDFATRIRQSLIYFEGPMHAIAVAMRAGIADGSLSHVDLPQLVREENERRMRITPKRPLVFFEHKHDDIARLALTHYFRNFEGTFQDSELARSIGIGERRLRRLGYLDIAAQCNAERKSQTPNRPLIFPLGILGRVNPSFGDHNSFVRDPLVPWAPTLELRERMVTMLDLIFAPQLLTYAQHDGLSIRHMMSELLRLKHPWTEKMTYTCLSRLAEGGFLTLKFGNGLLRNSQRTRLFFLTEKALAWRQQQSRAA